MLYLYLTRQLIRQLESVLRRAVLEGKRVLIYCTTGCEPHGVPTSTEPPGNAIGNLPEAGRAMLGMVRLYEHPISAQPTSSPPPPSLPSPPPPMAEDATAAARAAAEERADALCALTDVPSTRQGEFEAGFASAAAKLHPRIRRALVDDEVDTSDCM